MARDRVERLWIGGGSVVAVLVAAIAWLAVVHPELSKASSLHSQTDTVRTENSTLQAKLDKLQKDSAKVATLRQSLAQAQAALPAGTGLDAFTRQVSAQAAAAHVKITSLTATAPVPVAAATSAPTAPGGDTATTSSASATPSTPAPTSTNSAIAPASGQYSIAVTIAVSGTPAGDLAFLHALQTGGPRAVLVNSTQISSQVGGSGGAVTTLTAQLQVFASPQPAATPTAP
jgi:hypothetical protein